MSPDIENSLNEILIIKKLNISNVKEPASLVNSISLNIIKGQITALVGESGSGKTLTAKAILQLNSKLLKQSGDITFINNNQQQSLLGVDEKIIRQIRGNDICMVFQDPISSFNPSKRIGKQVEEAVLIHQKVSKKIAMQIVLKLFEKVQLGDIERIFNSYPFQLSGGQRQRVMIAMALVNKPKLLIADEPTTALDVTVQKEIIELIKNIQAEHQLSVLFITHDLSLLPSFAQYVYVMRNGNIVDEGDVDYIFSKSEVPYTKGLLACRPLINNRKYFLPTVSDFENNNLLQIERPLSVIDNANPIIDAQNINLQFKLKRKVLHALYKVSFTLYKGEVLGLVGESGSGKTTLSRTLLQLTNYSGKIKFNGQCIDISTRLKNKTFRKKIQFVFQDPSSSLNPNMKIGSLLSEAMMNFNIVNSRAKGLEKSEVLMQKVGLSVTTLNKYPHQLSGGQLQRVAIARAIALEPEIIILDEAVSALDVSVQAQVLNLLIQIKLEYNLTYIFITHDLSVISYIADRVIIMKEGEIVESGGVDMVMNNPTTDYTKQLLDSMPKNI